MPALRGRLGKGVGIAGPVEPRRGPTSGRQAARIRPSPSTFGPIVGPNVERSIRRRAEAPGHPLLAAPSADDRPERDARAGRHPRACRHRRFADGSVKGSGSRARGTPTWADFWTPGGQNSAQPFDLRPHGRAEQSNDRSEGARRPGRRSGAPRTARGAPLRQRAHPAPDASATLAAIPEHRRTVNRCRSTATTSRSRPSDRRRRRVAAGRSARRPPQLPPLGRRERPGPHRRHRGDGPRAGRGGSTSSRASRRAARAGKIFFDPSKTRVGIVTCGGLCPGLNNVIRGPRDGAHPPLRREPDRRVPQRLPGLHRPLRPSGRWS